MSTLSNLRIAQVPDCSSSKSSKMCTITRLLSPPLFLTVTTFIASLVFDSREYPATTLTRGLPSGRQIILQTPGFDLDLRIHTTKLRATALGQVLERGTKSLLQDLEIRLMKESMPITTVISDSLGTFKFSNISTGSFNILVVIPQHHSRILGAFSI